MKRMKTIIYSGKARIRQEVAGQWQELAQGIEAPGRLASSFALGTSLSFLPLPVIDSLLTMFLVLRYKRINKAAVFTARAVWNDLIVVPLYASGYKLGGFLVGRYGPPAVQNIELEPATVVLNFAAGNLIVAVAATLLAYLLALTAATGARRRVITATTTR